jgi:hypothetical protein
MRGIQFLRSVLCTVSMVRNALRISVVDDPRTLVTSSLSMASKHLSHFTSCITSI